MMFAGKLIMAIAATLALFGAMRRLKPNANSVLTFLMLGFPIGTALVIDLGISYGWLSLHLLAGAAAYAFSCELLIFLFTLVIGSVSVSLLLSVATGGFKGGTQKPSEPRTMLMQRLIALKNAGLIDERAGFYRGTSKGKRLVTVMNTLRHIFAHERNS
jgi:hypothetical protein